VDDALGGRLVEALLGRADGLAVTVAPAVLTRVFSSLFTALLRSWRLALVRLRFFWLLMLAIAILSGGREMLQGGR
jgi:hypothetical protein